MVDVACERDPQQEREALGPLHKAPGPGKVLGSDPDQQDKIVEIKKERKKVMYLLLAHTVHCYRNDSRHIYLYSWLGGIVSDAVW